MNITSAYEGLYASIQIRKLSRSQSWRSGYLQIILSLSGELKISCGGREYCQELLAFYSRDEISFDLDQPATAVFLLLKPRGILEAFGSDKLLRCPIVDFEPAERAELWEKLHDFIHMEYGADDPQYLGRSSILLALCRTLLDHCQDKEELPEPMVKLTERTGFLYRVLWSYIEDNYQEGISQAGTAEHFHITPQYLGRFLKETTGKTFRQILLEKQNQVQTLMDCYREKEEEEILLPGTSDTEIDRMNFSDGINSNRTVPLKHEYMNVNINPSRIMKDYWYKLINLGYATNLLEFSLSPVLAKVQKDLKFEYGRICRIVDLISVTTIRGQEIADYNEALRLLDQLIENGMTPYLELGNKTLIVQENNNVGFATAVSVDAEDYFNYLLHVLPGFLRTCINYYGQSEVDRWRFEVSYDFTSDTGEEKFGLYQYAGIFKKLYQIIHSYSRNCQVGGPGYNNWADEDEEKIIRYLKVNGVKPDFYTLYCYPLMLDERGKLMISDDPNILYKRVKGFSESLQKVFQKMDIWVSEFNSNLSARNYLNDSSYQAAFLAHTMLQFGTLNISAMGYYLLLDAPLRYRTPHDFLFGGWGLLNDQYVPKPSYYSYCCMRQLGRYHIKDMGSCSVSADTRGRFQIMAYRYCLPSEHFRRGNPSKEEMRNHRGLLVECGNNHYHLQMSNLLPGKYIVSEYRINASHSNIFAAWEKIGFLSPNNCKTKEEIARLTGWVPSMTVCEIGEDGNFGLDIVLTDWEVCFISFSHYAESGVGRNAAATISSKEDLRS